MRDAGRYDGMLGVLVALAVVEGARERDGGLPFAIEVLGFADEEGVRYGTAYLGSSVVAGTFDRSALDRRDADGIAMADAIAAFGGDPAALDAARRDPADLLGYVEVHIEQGPVLEAEDLPVGVVTGDRGPDPRVRSSSRGSPATPGPCRWRCAATPWRAPPSGSARSRRAGARSTASSRRSARRRSRPARATSSPAASR